MHPPPRTPRIFTIPGGSSESLPDISDAHRTVRRRDDNTGTPAVLPPPTPQVVDKSAVRRYYALMELLNTERGYLNDLQVLVEVYLSNLPTLTALPRTRSSPSIHLPSRRNSVFGSSTDVSPGNAPTRSHSYSRFGVPITSESGRSRNTLSACSFANTPLPPPNVHTPGTSKPATRESLTQSETQKLFTDKETDRLRRNAASLLDLHLRFVSALQRTLKSFGFLFEPGDDDQREINMAEGTHSESSFKILHLDKAVTTVCDQFVHQSADFNIYQTFCAGHTEALDLVRRAQEAHPAQWDRWERDCAAQASQAFERDFKSKVANADESCSDDDDGERSLKHHPSFNSLRHRHHSTPSLPSLGANRLSAPPSSNSSATSHSDGPSRPSPPKHAASDPAPTRATGQARLAFMDYLIKPVQRICKYPLLLEQLRSVKVVRPRRSREERERERASMRTMVSPRSYGRHTWREVETRDRNSVEGVDGDVDNAMFAMRRVALAVDEARRKREIETKSTLISTRLTAYARCPLPPPFLRSLGASLLAGGLDVVQSRGGGDVREPVRVKYLGAFLYVGGYFILAKVVKSGIYKVKHWFPLSGFEIVDLKEEAGLLPCSFRLVTSGYQFELAAACEGEKELWISAITESLTVRSRWEDEPPSSLSLDGQLRRASESYTSFSIADEFRQEMISSLPTVLSIDELEDAPAVPPLPAATATTSVSNTTVRVLAERPSVTFKSAGAALSKHSRNSSRSNSAHSIARPSPSRSASAASSMKSIFAPTSDATTILIRRSSAPRRAQVDRFLLDVFAEPCLSARFQAQSHGEELFRDPAMGDLPTGLSLGMSIAAKNRLTRKDSVLVPRQRSRCALSDGDGSEAVVGQAAAPREVANAGPLMMRAKSLASRRRPRASLRVKPTLSTLFTETEDSSDGRVSAMSPTSFESPAALPQSPVQRSNCSSVSHSQCASDAVPSPVDDRFPPAVRVEGVDAASVAVEDLDMALDFRPKRTRSLVGNVRGLLVPRSMSPESAHHSDSSDPTVHSALPEKHAGASENEVERLLTRFWRKASLRRRVRSAPDTPVPSPTPPLPEPALSTPTQQTPAPAKCLADPPATKPPYTTPETCTATAERKRHSSDGVHLRFTRQGMDNPNRTDTPQRRRSLFASGDKSLRRTFKNRLFFQHFNPMTQTSTPIQ